MGRGIERRKIFINGTDRNEFIDRLAVLAEEGAMDVYAWVLMPTHFHLLCKTVKRDLSSSMRKILTGYVVNFNRRHRRYELLFQNQYKSIVCQEDRYLGVTNSCVTRFAASGQKPDVDDLIKKL